MKTLSILFLAFFLLSPSAKADEPEQKEGISTGRYVTGGVIGSAVGFGIGHGIQGRYLPLGLVFTITEAVAMTAMIADLHETLTSTTFTRRYDIGTVGAIGLAVYCGFHIWEVIDVWVAGAKLRRDRDDRGEPKKKTISAAPEAPTLTAIPFDAKTGNPGLSVVLNF